MGCGANDSEDRASSPLLVLSVASLAYPARGGSVQALQGIDLSLEEGAIMTVLGPSGCGKTSLLQLVAGLLRPTAGQVLFDGHKVRGPSADRGVVFQHQALFPWYTVLENVALGPRFRGVPRKAREAEARRYLRLVGLEDSCDKPVYQLSGGQQQRVAIARALVNRPRILLMDEPFAALDALTRERMQNELLRIWRETRTTIFFITHSVDEAVYLGTTMIVMSACPGRIVARHELPFSRRAATEDPLAIRSDPHFAWVRERALRLIWSQ